MVGVLAFVFCLLVLGWILALGALVPHLTASPTRRLSHEVALGLLFSFLPACLVALLVYAVSARGLEDSGPGFLIVPFPVALAGAGGLLVSLLITLTVVFRRRREVDTEGEADGATEAHP